jgi:predicted nucleotide-binding protein (sugar kinase/HSP70/actin superfamily)
MKVFHGHVSGSKTGVDAILVPRLIGLRENEYICPMFCGLIEMLTNNIQNLPCLIDAPIISVENNRLSQWAQKAGGALTGDKNRVAAALDRAIQRQAESKSGFLDEGFPLKIALIGHPYNIHDRFVKMELKNKLNRHDIGAMTADCVGREDIEAEVKRLFKSLSGLWRKSITVPQPA